MIDRTYDEFEAELKDLLSWFQKATWELGTTPISLSKEQATTMNNARQAILNHCRRFDKKRKLQYGII
jgi:hypothetical protein